MLAVPRAIGPSSLTKWHKRKALIRIHSNAKDQGFKGLDSSFLNALKIPQSLISLKKTIEIIYAIENVIVIKAFADPDLKALSQRIGSIRPIFLLRTIVTGRLEKITKI